MEQEKTKDIIREEALAAIGDNQRCGVAITVGYFVKSIIFAKKMI